MCSTFNNSCHNLSFLPKIIWWIRPKITRPLYLFQPRSKLRPKFRLNVGLNKIEINNNFDWVNIFKIFWRPYGQFMCWKLPSLLWYKTIRNWTRSVKLSRTFCQSFSLFLARIFTVQGHFHAKSHAWSKFILTLFWGQFSHLLAHFVYLNTQSNALVSTQRLHVFLNLLL
jgi:hypothetical protein